MLLTAVFLVATGIFTRPKDPVTQELRHFSIENAGDAGRNFDEDIFMAVGSHADLSTTNGPSAVSRDVNASDPAGRNASLLQGLSLASVEAASVEQALGLGTKADAVQETETGKTSTAGAQDHHEVDPELPSLGNAPQDGKVQGLLETAQEETASEVRASALTCYIGEQDNPKYAPAQKAQKAARVSYRVKGGDNTANFNQIAAKAASEPETLPKFGTCCLTPYLSQDGKGTEYFRDDCSCFDLIACGKEIGYTKAQTSTLDGNQMKQTDNTLCPDLDHAACSRVRK